MIEVKVRRVPGGSEHDDQKWIVLEGYVEGYPEVTKRTAINTFSLADGSVSLATEKERLVAVVREYLERIQAAQRALTEL